MRRTLSLRARVALLAGAAVGVVVALAALAVFVTARAELQHEIDRSLLSRARAAAATPLGDPALLIQVPSSAFGAADVRLALVRADGEEFPALGEAALPVGPQEFAVAAGLRPDSLRTVQIGGVPYRLVAVPVSPGLALVLARSLAETERVTAALALVLVIVGLVGIVAAASAGLAVARAGLAPVERLTGAAERVARTKELRPIEVSGNDEIGRLARAFNAMLVALADSQTRQRQLVVDAGHELRTPLTSLRTNLDLLAQTDGGRDLPAGERGQLLADVRAQVGELTDLVGDLVQLAREDAQEEPVDSVDLIPVVERAVERARLRASGLNFEIHLEPWRVDGRAGQLERAVTNLLDNAVKWSPPGGTVSVTLRGGVLRVADEGPGIDEADRPHVFDRFYRAADARRLPGSGLGLAIVRQTAESHGGSVEAGSAYGGGALLTMRLPGRIPDPEPAPVSSELLG